MHLRRTILGLLVCCLAGCGGSGGTGVVLVIDQEHVPGSPDALVGTSATIDWAQTFLVGLTGDLHRLDLSLEQQGATGTALIELRTTTGGVPDDGAGAVLATALVSASSLPTFGSSTMTSLPISPPLALTAGQVVAIVLTHAGGAAGDILWNAEQGDPYGPGTAYQRTAGNGNAFVLFPGDSDFYLRTWMELP